MITIDFGLRRSFTISYKVLERAIIFMGNLHLYSLKIKARKLTDEPYDEMAYFKLEKYLILQYLYHYYTGKVIEIDLIDIGAMR